MVSVQAYNEKPLLHHLPYIQLGPSYDVFSACFCKRIFYTDAVFACDGNLACMGALCNDVSGAFLGGNECGTQVQRMYR